MSTFQVPQFVDQKTKIVGSLNMLQFGYVAIAALAIFGMYYVFNFVVWLIISIPIAGAAVFLGFAKINGQESHKIIGSFFGYLLGSKNYVWRREEEKIPDTEPQKKSVEHVRAKMSIQEKIKSIALSVTTGKILNKHEHPHEESAGLATEQKGFDVATFSTGEKKLVKRVDY
jgi:hypothetical protein